MKDLFLIGLLAFWLISCQQEVDKASCQNSNCGSRPHYDAVLNLKWEQSTFSFQGQLFDSELNNKEVPYDMALARLEAQEFLPIQNSIEAALPEKQEQVVYTILYYDIDLSLDKRTISAEDVKAISTFAYVEIKDRYQHTLYRKTEGSQHYTPEEKGLIREVNYNNIGKLIREEIFPNQTERGYIVLQNLTKGKEIYNARNSTSSLMITPTVPASNASYRDIPGGSAPVCDGFCNTLIKGLCKDDGISYNCKSSGCIVDDFTIAESIMQDEFDNNLYYVVRDHVLDGSSKGNTYIEDYYYVSGVLHFSDITPLIPNLRNALPNINEALQCVLNSSQHGSTIAVNSALKNDLMTICNDLKQLSVLSAEEKEYLRIINKFEADLNTVYNGQMTVQDLINFINT